MSDELDELRKKRLRELQDNSNIPSEDAIHQQEEAQKAYEQQKQALLRAILSESAKQRLENIKLVKPQLAVSIEDQLIHLAQSGRISGEVSEEQLLQLLRQLQSRKRDSTIRFKRV